MRLIGAMSVAIVFLRKAVNCTFPGDFRSSTNITKSNEANLLPVFSYVTHKKTGKREKEMGKQGDT